MKFVLYYFNNAMYHQMNCSKVIPNFEYTPAMFIYFRRLYQGGNSRTCKTKPETTNDPWNAVKLDIQVKKNFYVKIGYHSAD